MPKIELLSPARNLECGLAAVNHGADAIYIGAARFGARQAADNSIQDIDVLTKYAHRFRTKVYVTLNTILTDSDLSDAEKLIWDIYNIGVDALIVQDMGILQMNLPPIALHASTQSDNRTAEKVRFLQDVGFSRVVLARELTLQQIAEIRAQTNIELEAFVHGALCVSYSGQCYISEAMCKRSANRGQCAQFCRLPYDLLDAEGRILQRNRHLLSLKDLDLSAHLGSMLDAGISSFKIEGRLKDANYVKNITAFYRKKIDLLLEEKQNFSKSSLGATTFFFDPNPEKSFRREATDYFITGRHSGIYKPETPKSLGEKIGKVRRVGENFIESENAEILHNGDGICYLNRDNELTGFRVNRIENGKIFPFEQVDIQPNTIIYRNHDQAFEKLLNANSAVRKMAVKIIFSETNTGFSLQIIDEEQISVTLQIDYQKQLANDANKANGTLSTQLAKLGNTIYVAQNVEINCQTAYFFPISLINSWRTQAIEILDLEREKLYKRNVALPRSYAVYPEKTLNYRANISNKLSAEFYQLCGVENLEQGFEIEAQSNVPLMFTKHCIKYEMGWCARQNAENKPPEPLYLLHNNQRFELKFDCARCEMHVLKVE
ncbi:MAG: U32 family peptidase [Paludibacter sp.]|jgi:putative protease|nr:U32 family peptidase [Paludibacter sp.]